MGRAIACSADALTMGGLKHDLVHDIADRLRVDPPPMSTGSTEPKAILLAANEILGLGHDPRLSKPKLAAAICESAGLEWDYGCESTGSTITAEGLLRVRRAIAILTDGRQ